MKTISLPITLFILGSLVSCNTGTDPKETCDFTPGNRDFTWQVDTVAWFPSTLGGVWAFADDDAYLMGYIVDNTSPSTLRLGRHWNGEEWEDDINGTWGFDNATETWGDIKITPRNDATGDDHVMVAVGHWGINGKTYGGIAEYDNRTKTWESYQLQEAEGELRQVWTDGKGYFIAVGDSGMVYTKDGRGGEWVYTKAPTDFSFYKLSGVSKNEIYAVAHLSVPGEAQYDQVWKISGNNWNKLYDNQNASESIVYIEGAMTPLQNYISDVATYRCPVTDSLQLYFVGHQSFLLESSGQSHEYEVTNINDLGLPLGQNDISGIWVDFFSPNDIWFYGERFHFYHWNGQDFQKMEIPGLPHNQFQYGAQLNMVKTKSGKVFLPTEVRSQVYVIAQGIPD